MDLIPFSLTDYSLESYFIRITSRSKVIYWLIIVMVLSVLVILPLVYVDVSVQARGYFQSDIEKQFLISPYQGKVLYSSVQNGQHISAGDTLLIIDSETIRGQYSALLKKISENNASIRDLEKLTSGISSEADLRRDLTTLRYTAEYANLVNQHAIQLQKYQKKVSEHERINLLHNQSIVPDIDYENSLFSLNNEKVTLNQVLIYQQSIWQNDLSIRNSEAAELEAELGRYLEELKNRIILAPVSGEIIKTSDIQVGGLISSGQKIAEISPDGVLVANCFVKPSDIGLIHENQKVRIQVDAFNYNEWGMLQGEITDISDDMILDDANTPYFRIKCKPDQTYLTLKNGHRADVKKGMSLNTRIVVIKRSLYNLLFDKADRWFNPYVYNPG